MKLIFEQTPEHIKDLQKKVLFSGRGKVYLIVLILVILFNIFYFISSNTGADTSSIEPVNLPALILSWIIPIVIIILIWYFIIKFIIKRVSGRSSIEKNSPSIIGSRELDITEENIHYKTKEFTGTFNWSGLTDFKESKLCYFLHIGRVQAIVVPKSAFESKEQEAEFTTLVNKKLRM